MPYVSQYGAEALLSNTGALLPSTAVTVLNTDNTTATLYTNLTGTTTGPNPVYTDGSGNLTFYVVPAVYQLKVAGVVIGVVTVEPLPHAATHATGGTDPVTFPSGGTLIAAPTGVAATDTATLQNALNALPAGGGVIRCPSGTYVINATLTQAVGYSTIEGSGRGATTIRTTAAIRMIDSGGFDGMTLRNLTVDGGGVATNLWHPYVSGTLGQHFRTDHVRFINAAATATLVDTFGGVNYSIADCRFYDTDFVTGGIGITLGDYDNQFFGCTFGVLGTAGVKFQTGRAGAGGAFHGCIWSGNKADLLIAVTVSSLSFFGRWFENCSQAVVALSGTLANAGQMHFHNCNLTSSGTYLFDLTGSSLTAIELWGGTMNPSVGTQLNLPYGSTVSTRSVLNTGSYTVVGSGYFIRDSCPADVYYPGRELLAGHFAVGTVGYGLRVAEGTNAKQGVATLVAGTVTVSNTSVTASSRIQLTSQADGGTPGYVRVSSRIAGSSFTITSGSATDTSVVAYDIFEPA